MPPMSPIVCTAEVSPESGFLATRVHNVAWGTGSGDPVDLVLGGLRSRLDHQLVDVHVRRTGRDPRNRIGHVLGHRSEEHTSELQSLMRISYAVFCLKKKKYKKQRNM